MELARGMIAIQQATLENIFEYSELYPDLIKSCSDFLRGRNWKTHSFFPGPVNSTLLDVTHKGCKIFHSLPYSLCFFHLQKFQNNVQITIV